MLPVLIIAFARPGKLELLLKHLVAEYRKIYVFVDCAEKKYVTENEEVKRIVEKYKNEHVLVKVANENLGVGKAVPNAISWILSLEDEAVILEDDCFLSPCALNYFDDNIKYVRDDIVMLSGMSPFDFIDPFLEVSNLSLSKYPLVWGWATTRDAWCKLNEIPISQNLLYNLVLAVVSRNSIIAKAFFFAAVLRARSGLLQAWDSEIAYKMLIGNLRSVVPNISVVGNSGNDEVAHHADITRLEVRELTKKEPSKVLNLSKRDQNLTNLEIERKIFKLKNRHLVSPLKAKLYQLLCINSK